MGEENESVRERRDPSGLFAVEIDSVCSVFDMGNKSFFRLQGGYEFKIYESWRQRAAKRLRELFHEIRKKRAPHGWINADIFDQLVEFWHQEDFKRLQWTNTKNQASKIGGSMHTGGSTTYPATRERMVLEIGRTPSFSEVFERTHTRKTDRSWVDKRSHDCKEAFEAEKNRLEAERQVIIAAGGPEPPPIDEEAIWLRISGGRKKGRIYGKGVIPAHTVPLIIGDVDDPPDVREQVTLLNRELSQQAEANCQRVAQVEAVCDEKVWTLETALESQSQEVSQLRKAYSDMYNFLEQMRSGASGSAAFTAMPPPSPRPPPPPTRSLTPSPQPDGATSPSQHDDDPDYV
ncbi:hypothetical protein PIB30_054732 [Stylosanthes scabra]|uniref:Transposase n=1 Tax=Stylosanthes scabra TaxID=79078 RepID=A0ABU6SJN6_9FABA|nr:hypothetical protein [Stylosanthes scabra]